MEHKKDNGEHNYPPRSWWGTRGLIFLSSLCLPMLPLIGFIAILWFLITPEGNGPFPNFLDRLPHPDMIFFPKPERILIHLGDLLTYVSAASFHSILCVFAIGYFLSLTFKPPRMLWRRALVFIMCEFALFVLLGWFLQKHANTIMLIQLGYKAICAMLSHAHVEIGIVGDCFDSGVSRLTWLAWIPTFLGLATVLCGAAFAYTATGGLPHVSDPEWRSKYTAHIHALQRSLYVASIVLVSSTFTMMLFFHLPSGLLNPKDPNHLGLADAVTTYVDGLVVLWGGLFTLTLISTFASSAFLLWRDANRFEAHLPLGKAKEEFQSWMHAHVFVSLRHQLVNVVTVLAPLMVGPVGDLLGKLGGG